jgi:hypothetical protein
MDINTIITKKGLQAFRDGADLISASCIPIFGLVACSSATEVGVQLAEIKSDPSQELAVLESCMFLDNVLIHIVDNNHCT